MMQNVKQGATYLMLSPEKKIPPTIIFSKRALKWIECLVDAHNEEIGFFGVVDDLPDYSYFVRDIFYPKHQLVTSATCEISPEGETKIMEWLIDHNRENDINKMILWGHSHHTMGVFASGQDDTQALQRMHSNKANVIRVIVNKEGLMSVSFLDYEQQIRFDNVVWKIENQNDEDAEFNLKLNGIKGILDSNLAASLKLSSILEIIQSDTDKKNIVEKIKLLKEENVPTKSVVSPYGAAWDTKDGYDHKRTPLQQVWPPIRNYNGVRQNGPQFVNPKTFNDEGFDDLDNSVAVQDLLKRYEEF